MATKSIGSQMNKCLFNPSVMDYDAFLKVKIMNIIINNQSGEDLYNNLDIKNKRLFAIWCFDEFHSTRNHPTEILDMLKLARNVANGKESQDKLRLVTHEVINKLLENIDSITGHSKDIVDRVIDRVTRNIKALNLECSPYITDHGINNLHIASQNKLFDGYWDVTVLIPGNIKSLIDINEFTLVSSEDLAWFLDISHAKVIMDIKDGIKCKIFDAKHIDGIYYINRKCAINIAMPYNNELTKYIIDMVESSGNQEAIDELDKMAKEWLAVNCSHGNNYKTIN